MPRRGRYDKHELLPDARGVVAVLGCVRHDLAVAVTSDKAVYAVGTRAPGADEDDRVFTPLSAHDDCDEGKPPRRIFALVQEDGGLDNTIGRVYQNHVAAYTQVGMVARKPDCFLKLRSASHQGG